jgi:hypothetical protein
MDLVSAPVLGIQLCWLRCNVGVRECEACRAVQGFESPQPSSCAVLTMSQRGALPVVAEDEFCWLA